MLPTLGTVPSMSAQVVLSLGPRLFICMTKGKLLLFGCLSHLKAVFCNFFLLLLFWLGVGVSSGGVFLSSDVRGGRIGAFHPAFETRLLEYEQLFQHTLCQTQAKSRGP